MKISPQVLGLTALVLVLTGARQSDHDTVMLWGACQLVTRAEAATALGGSVPEGAEKVMNLPMEGASIEAQYCLYGTEVVVARFELGASAQPVFAQYRESLASEPGYQSLDGVGDEAFIAKGQLAARKGETGLIIDVGQARGGGAKEVEAEKVLAAHALGRI